MTPFGDLWLVVLFAALSASTAWASAPRAQRGLAALERAATAACGGPEPAAALSAVDGALERLRAAEETERATQQVVEARRKDLFDANEVSRKAQADEQAAQKKVESLQTKLLDFERAVHDREVQNCAERDAVQVGSLKVEPHRHQLAVRQKDLQDAAKALKEAEHEFDESSNSVYWLNPIYMDELKTKVKEKKADVKAREADVKKLQQVVDAGDAAVAKDRAQLQRDEAKYKDARYSLSESNRQLQQRRDQVTEKMAVSAAAAAAVKAAEAVLEEEAAKHRAAAEDTDTAKTEALKAQDAAIRILSGQLSAANQVVTNMNAQLGTQGASLQDLQKTIVRVTAENNARKKALDELRSSFGAQGASLHDLQAAAQKAQAELKACQGKTMKDHFSDVLHNIHGALRGQARPAGPDSVKNLHGAVKNHAQKGIPDALNDLNGYVRK